MKKRKMSDLIERGRLYYERFADVPFTGRAIGRHQGAFRGGKKHGIWITYSRKGDGTFNDRLWIKSTYKDGIMLDCRICI
jgi:hypothetical protein